MQSRRPAEPGMTVDQVQTPAIIVDLDALEDNITFLASRVAQNPGASATPHAKAHKCVEIAQRQIAAGASRVCCQNVAEVEAMVAGGIRSVLLSNEIVAEEKARRLARSAREAKIGVCVDHPLQADILSLAAQEQSVTLNVLVEIDVGHGRCGIAPGPDAVKLAQYVTGKPGLHFAGLQAYDGAAQHLRKPDQRTAAITRAASLVRETIDLLKAAELACETVAGAGTGSYENELASGVYTELQCGSYALMDADYGRNETDRPFKNSLFVLTTVISNPLPARAVCDAGLKSLTAESGLPVVRGARGVTYVKATDEHGTLELSPDATITIGDKLRLIPGHCDPTVNLHDWLVAYRGDKVEAVWPVIRGW
ncbi:MAG: DSD1 family PLP-dependent enzyme [Xanthobacteraceae bacterium]|nr:DSD1 family PLP-dependent enzyme [Xanthobacteraceae bacterium]